MITSAKTLHIRKTSTPPLTRINLPASKSIANRALMLQAFAQGGTLENLSNARDTETMQRLLADDGDTWDVLDAGTTMRFLTAFAAMRCDHKLLTGTPRMKERPIGLLADALTELGAKISYPGREGYPPMVIQKLSEQKTDRLTIRGDISSQYISALLMIAPVLPAGLTLTLTGRIGSRPYINMTLAVMRKFGVRGEWLDDQRLHVAPQPYRPVTYHIEPDWSAASYWYSVVALNPSQEVLLTDLKDDSIQGDRKMADIMTYLGVRTRFNEEGAWLSAGDRQNRVEIDFTDCPDLAQTICAICAQTGTTCRMTGLESLRIKETDRISALQNELGKIGATLEEHSGTWELQPAEIIPDGGTLTFSTYHDHRMAMALAPLATNRELIIEDPAVVNKSYPHFWTDLETAGFSYL